MGIRMKWGNLRDQEFMQSLGKLYAQPMDFEFGVRFATLGQEIKKQQKLMDETHEGILKKFGTPNKDKRGTYNISDENRDAYAEEMTKLADHSFESKVNRFDALALSELVKFSPQDLMLLEPLLLPFEIPAETTPLKVAAAEPPPQPTAH